MTWFRCGGGSGMPADLKNRMNAVLNKKFGTSGQNYPPKQWPDDVNLLGPLPEGTASGPIASFSDGADDVPTKSIVVTIPPTLSGKSEVTETQISSRNMASMSDADFTLNSVHYYTENGVLYIDGTSTNETSSNNNAFKVLDFWLPSGTYYFSRGTTLTSLNVPAYLKKYDDKSQIVVNTGSFTLSEKTHLYIGLYVYQRTFSNIKAEICINLGSTAITYEDTEPMTQYLASLGRTIYGGTADFVNGTGKDTTLRYELDENDSWSAYSGASHSFWHNVATGEDRPIKQTEASESICNYATYSSASPSSAPDFSFLIQGGQRIVVTADSTIDTVEKFKTWLSSHNLVFVCPASTPTDFTFTGQEVNTRLGYNAFWSDEGDTEVTYRADISLALQALSGSRGLMMASRPAAQMVGEESDLDQVNELVEDNETEQEDENNAR